MTPSQHTNTLTHTVKVKHTKKFLIVSNFKGDVEYILKLSNSDIGHAIDLQFDLHAGLFLCIYTYGAYVFVCLFVFVCVESGINAKNHHVH